MIEHTEINICDIISLLICHGKQMQKIKKTLGENREAPINVFFNKS